MIINIKIHKNKVLWKNLDRHQKLSLRLIYCIRKRYIWFSIFVTHTLRTLYIEITTMPDDCLNCLQKSFLKYNVISRTYKFQCFQENCTNKKYSISLIKKTFKILIGILNFCTFYSLLSDIHHYVSNFTLKLNVHYLILSILTITCDIYFICNPNLFYENTKISNNLLLYAKSKNMKNIVERIRSIKILSQIYICYSFFTVTMLTLFVVYNTISNESKEYLRDIFLISSDYVFVMVVGELLMFVQVQKLFFITNMNELKNKFNEILIFDKERYPLNYRQLTLQLKHILKFNQMISANTRELMKPLHLFVTIMIFVMTMLFTSYGLINIDVVFCKLNYESYFEFFKNVILGSSAFLNGYIILTFLDEFSTQVSKNIYSRKNVVKLLQFRVIFKFTCILYIISNFLKLKLM